MPARVPDVPAHVLAHVRAHVLAHVLAHVPVHVLAHVPAPAHVQAQGTQKRAELFYFLGDDKKVSGGPIYFCRFSAVGVRGGGP